MIDPRTNIIGERVLITSRGQTDRKVFGRGVVRAIDLQGGAFMFLIEAVGAFDWRGSTEDGELFEISTWDESAMVVVDREVPAPGLPAHQGLLREQRTPRPIPGEEVNRQIMTEYELVEYAPAGFCLVGFTFLETHCVGKCPHTYRMDLNHPNFAGMKAALDRGDRSVLFCYHKSSVDGNF